jgi:hypothetical protein
MKMNCLRFAKERESSPAIAGEISCLISSLRTSLSLIPWVSLSSCLVISAEISGMLGENETKK